MKKTNKAVAVIVILNIVAIAVTLAIGGTAVSSVKLTGSLLAILLVVPVWLLLALNTRRPTATRWLIIFLGGFLYKLAGMTASLIWVVRYSGWDVVQFLTGCLPLLIALQISESIYFWGQGGLMGVNNGLKTE